jgi:hypothetical protein
MSAWPCRLKMMGNFFVGHFAPFEDKAKCVTVDFMPGKREGTLQIIGSKTDIETGAHPGVKR